MAFLSKKVLTTDSAPGLIKSHLCKPRYRFFYKALVIPQMAPQNQANIIDIILKKN
jgi:hypothetical protein